MDIVVDNEGYLYYKFIHTLVYADNYDEVFEDFLIRFGKPRLLSLILLNVIVVNLNNTIDKTMERNILNFNSYLKELFKTEDFRIDYPEISKDACYELSNEIISHVNSNKINGNSLAIFCAEELSLRGYGVADRFVLTGSRYLISTFNTIKSFLRQDFALLAALYADESGELFELKKDEYSNPNYSYISSIKVLVQENPNLLDNERFMLRAKYIIEHYKNNVDNGNYNKDIKKKMLLKIYKDIQNELNKSTIK